MGKGDWAIYSFFPILLYCMVMMFDMRLLHYRGIANLSYVAHVYVLVTYDIDILILCEIMWLWLNIIRFNAI